MLRFILIIFTATHFVKSKTLWNFDQPKSGGELLVIDTDAGADDAMAISMVLNGTKEANLRVAGITCNRGNTGVHNVTINVLRTLSVNNRLEIPVFVGSDYGLIATSVTDDYFGEDGLGDFDYDVPDVPPSPDHPAVFLSNIVRKNPGKVTVLALAPLTNLAIAGLLYSEFYRDVRQIIFLGGSTDGHGSMDGVEFNVWADPTAAIAVFTRSPLDNPITIVPAETLHSMIFPWDWRKNILGTKGTDTINFLNLAERKVLENPKGWQVDDPAAAGVYLYPELALDSFLGRPNITSNGSMKIERIDPESEIQAFSNSIGGDNGYVRVVSSINKAKLKQILFDLL